MLTMTELQIATKKIDGKLEFLEFISVEMDKLVKRKERKPIERHIKAFETKVKEINALELRFKS